MRPLAVILALFALSGGPATGQQLRELLTTSDVPMPPDRIGAQALADVDRDGDLDLIAGGPAWLWLLRNDGDAAFTRDAAAVPAVSGEVEALALGDVDGDGDVDLVVGRGSGTAALANVLLLNDGSGRFVDASSQLMATPRQTTALALADVDQDGDLDLFEGAFGTPNEGYLRLLQNDGRGRFTDVTAAQVLRRGGLYESARALAVGDVDGDNDVDLVLGAKADHVSTYGGEVTLWLNSGTGSFAPALAQLFLQEECVDVALGDIDGDGDLDLTGAVPGFGIPNPGRTLLLRNDGTGTFAEAAGNLPSSSVGGTFGAVFVDLDSDTDLDIVASQWTGDRAYLNDGTGRFTDGSATWIPPVWNGLSGAFAVGDVDRDGDSDLIELGNVPRVLRNGGGAGPLWEASVQRVPVFPWPWSAVAAGDVDGDGDEDLIGAIAYVGVFLHRNDGAGVFEPFEPVPGGSAALDLADVDGDGDLDLAFAEGAVGLSLNDGTGTFTNVTSTNMAFAWPGASVALARGDLDGDGDVDYVVGTSGDRDRVILNDGTGRFADVTPTALPGAVTSTWDVVLGDVDGDGDVDLYRCLHASSVDDLYLNNGSGVFAPATGMLPALPKGSNTAAFTDLDGDGDLDLVLAHLGALDHCRVLENDGTGKFAEVTATRLPGPTFEAEDVVVADFDQDGDTDALFARSQRPGARLFLNDGTGVLLPAPGYAAWSQAIGIYRGPRNIAADIDGDGDPDVVGDQLLLNLHRQVETTSAALGHRLRITVTVEPGYVGPGALAVPLLAAGPAATPIPIPSLGVLRIDPTTAVALPALPVPSPAGTVSWTAFVPASSTLVGAPVWMQAAVRHGGPGPTFHLTNAARVHVNR